MIKYKSEDEDQEISGINMDEENEVEEVPNDIMNESYRYRISFGSTTASRIFSQFVK